MKNLALLLVMIGVQSILQAQSVRITALRLVNDTTSKIDVTKPIRLNYKQNYLAIHFEDTFNSASPDFHYRLSSVDWHWIKSGRQNVAMYSNLYSGDYTFWVKNARINQSSTQLKFTIEPAFWQRWWFIPLLFLQGIFVISIVLYLLYLYRIRQFLRLQQTRDRIARDLHDDMGSYLSSISIMSRSAANATAKDPERARQSLDKIGETARRVMGAMSDIVWSINPDHDSLDKVVARMQDAASELFAPTGTTVSVEADPAVLTLNLPLEKRHDFFLIYKEAITNAARYSEATQVRIRLHREGIALILVVQDNGQGFDITQLRTRSGGGNGLKNMHVRAGKIGGMLTIESELGQGTTVTLRV